MNVVQFGKVAFNASPEVQANIRDKLTPGWILHQRVPATVSATALPKRRRAAVYMRYSTDEQDPYSFERQLKVVQDYAASIDVDIVKIFSDPAQSGAFTANRPGFQAMLDAAKNGEFEILVIEAGDRLSRKLHITTAAFSILAEHNVELHSGQMGKWSLMHAAFSGMMSEEHRARISELMRSGIVKILNRGLWPGRAPIGFNKVSDKPGELVIDEEMAAVVRRAYRMRIAGLDEYKIARLFQDEGVPSSNGIWYPTTVRYMLSNPLYIGVIIFFKTSQKRIQTDENTISSPRKVRPVDEWQYGERVDWQIVDLEEWQQVQVLQARKRKNGPTPQYLLSGKVVCGACGEVMHVGARHRGRSWMRCSKNWRLKYFKLDGERCEEPGVQLDSLEDEIIRLACQKLDTKSALPDMQAAYEKKATEQAAVLNAERARLQNERAAIHKRLDATYDESMSRGLTTEVLQEQRANYCARIGAIDGRLAAIPLVVTTKMTFMKAPLDTASFLAEFTPARNYRDCGEALGRLLAVFQMLIDTVTVTSDLSRNDIRVLVTGPIAHVQDEGTSRIAFRYKPDTRNGWKLKSADADARNGNFDLSDSDWDKIKDQLPSEPIWIDEFDEPVEFRKVLGAVLMLKKTKVGAGNLPDAFGPRRQIWAAARILSYGGVLELAETVLKNEDIAVGRGLKLSLDSARSPAGDLWKRHSDCNARRMSRVLARLASRERREP